MPRALSVCAGRLGLVDANGEARSLAVPRRLPGFGGSAERRVVCVAAAEMHSLALTAAGEVFSWGAQAAPLGYDSAAHDQLTPRHVKLPAAAHGSHGTPYGAHLGTSSGHSLVATRCGHVYAWGTNDKGQLGLGGCARRRAARVAHVADDTARMRFGSARWRARWEGTRRQGVAWGSRGGGDAKGGHAKGQGGVPPPAATRREVRGHARCLVLRAQV